MNISDSKNILILAQKVSSYDMASAIVSLYNTLKSQDKNVDVVIKSKSVSKIADLFEKYSLKYDSVLKSSDYEIWIDYGISGIKKITYDTDEESKKLKFVITPGDGEFSFDNVEFKQGGCNYDLLITLGIDDYKSLGSFYDENEYLFREIQRVAFSKEAIELAQVSIEIGNDSYCEKVFDYLKSLDVPLGKETIELLLNGTINHKKILEGMVSSNSWSVISSMVADGGDMNKTINDIYYSKTQENLHVQIKLMQNVKLVKDRRLIWAYITKKDLNSYKVTKSNLDIRGRIEFNISKDFDYAFAVYEIDDEVLKVVVESNTPEILSASNIAGVFGGSGSDTHAEFTVKKLSIDEFEKRVFAVLDDLLDVEKEAKVPDIVHD